MGAAQAYIWEDKVFRSDFMGARLQRHIISAPELDAKIAGAPICSALGCGEAAVLPALEAHSGAQYRSATS